MHFFFLIYLCACIHGNVLNNELKFSCKITKYRSLIANRTLMEGRGSKVKIFKPAFN